MAALEFSVNRVFLTGLALGPLFAFAAGSATAISLPVAVMLSGAGSLYALVASLRLEGPARSTGREKPTASPRLLHRSAMGDPSLDLPQADVMRAWVSDALQVTPETIEGAPLRIEDAISAALTQVMRAQGSFDLNKMTRADLADLYALSQLLVLPPDRAGAMAQSFRRPDVVLEMRDRVADIAQARRVFDTHMDAFLETQSLWASVENKQAVSESILDRLQSLQAPDIDLWHFVVQNHDRSNAGHRAAALWCVQQPQCDQATVAIFLSELVADNRLIRAAHSGDLAVVDSALEIVANWNAGLYTTRELALDPVDAVAQDGPRLSAVLTALAETTQGARPPDPCGMFTEYRGRTPRDRTAWSLVDGLPQRAPRLEDYIQTAASSVS